MTSDLRKKEIHTKRNIICVMCSCEYTYQAIYAIFMWLFSLVRQFWRDIPHNGGKRLHFLFSFCFIHHILWWCCISKKVGVEEDERCCCCCWSSAPKYIKIVVKNDEKPFYCSALAQVKRANNNDSEGVKNRSRSWTVHSHIFQRILCALNKSSILFFCLKHA